MVSIEIERSLEFLGTFEFFVSPVLWIFWEKHTLAQLFDVDSAEPDAAFPRPGSIHSYRS